MSAAQFDVTIVGGGIVGTLLAHTLCQQGNQRIALIEASQLDGESPHPGLDERVIALSKRSVDTLQSLAVNPHVEGATAIEQILVTDQGHLGQCLLNADDFGHSPFGLVVGLRALGVQIQQAVTERYTAFCPATVTQVTQHSDAVQLVLDSGEELHTQLLVLADGGRSGLAEQCGIGYQALDYAQHAIICNIAMDAAHNGLAHERFTQNGPLALLPYQFDDAAHGQGYSVVWTLPPEAAEQQLNASNAQFITALQQQIGYRHGLIKAVSKRFAYPLALRTADNLVSHRVALVGNAAQTLHPIAGQGFNLGLRDVMALANALQSAEDCGAYNVLRSYQQARSGDRAHTIGMTDGLVRVFSNSDWPMVPVRNVGLALMNHSTTLQQVLVQQATGYGASSRMPTE